VVIYNATYVLLIMRYIPTTATTILLSIAIMFATLLLLAAPFVMGQSDIPLSQDIQGVLAVNNNSLYHYPTDLTQGIMPKNVHSHNDYWRAKPFYTALSNGVISVEADVWLYNGTLYVCTLSCIGSIYAYHEPAILSLIMLLTCSRLDTRPLH